MNRTNPVDLSMMKWTMLAVAVFLTACPTFGQQASTTTTCDKDVGDHVVCKTEQTPPTLAEILSPKKHAAQPQPVATAAPTGLSPEAVKAFLAEQKGMQEAKDTVDFIYCRQNPKGTITDSNGQPRVCGDVLAYTKAFCSVNPQAERCTLAKSKAEVERAFAALLNQYNSDNHRSRPWEQSYYGERFAKLTKWGCMSFPDMVLPGPDGSSHSCPDAPEPAAARADAPQPK